MDITEIAETVRKRQQAQRSLPTLLQDATQGAKRLAHLTRAWDTFAPTPAALTEAQAGIEGLRRTVAEIEHHQTHK